MTPDELKSIPKGNFVVMKTGTHPMRTKLRLFLDWGITFNGVYTVPERANRRVFYADKKTLEENIVRKHLSFFGVMDENGEEPLEAAGGTGALHTPINDVPENGVSRRRSILRT